MKLKKTKYILMKVGLGVLVFAATVGVVLGISILIGALKEPVEEGDTTSTATSDSTPGQAESVNVSGFAVSAPLPYETETYKIEYVSESDTLVVHMYPDLTEEGSLIDQQNEIKDSARTWIRENGGDPEAMESAEKLEFTMK